MFDLKFLLVILVSFILSLFGISCSLFDAHVDQMSLLRGMASDVTQRLSDGSVGQISASGQAMSPGIAIEAAIIYKAQVYYKDLAGQFQISAHGTLGDREFNQSILNIINDNNLDDVKRMELIKLLTSREATVTPTDGQ